MKVKDYKDLLIWKKGIEITDKVYQLTRVFPKEETYALTSQMRRSSISISSNIAEGFVRRNSKEYRQFLYIALGSCAELDTQFIISHRRKYVQDAIVKDMLEQINHEMRMLRSLILKLN